MGNTSHSAVWGTRHIQQYGEHVTFSSMGNTSHSAVWGTRHIQQYGEHVTFSSMGNMSYSALPTKIKLYVMQLFRDP